MNFQIKKKRVDFCYEYCVKTEPILKAIIRNMKPSIDCRFVIHPYFLPTFNNTQQTFFIGLQLSTFAGELASKAIVATIQFISHRISSQKPDVVLSAGRTEHVLVHFKHGVDWHKSKEKCIWLKASDF